jgi:hypothetical protein
MQMLRTPLIPFVALLAAGLPITGVPKAIQRDPRLDVSAIRDRLKNAQAQPVRSWMSPDILASSKTPLVYVSLITSATTGQTNIYKQHGISLTLVGQLSTGGGPVAVDSEQNVYIGEVGNPVGFAPRNIDVFARGATTPMRTLIDPDSAEYIAVAKDGTVYVAGQTTAYGNPSRVLKFARGRKVGEILPPLRISPVQPIGVGVDASGDVFTGWFATKAAGSNDKTSACLRPLADCVLELPVGGGRWKMDIPSGTAINGLQAGPILDSAGDRVVVTGSNFYGEYLLTFPPGSSVVSSAKALPRIRLKTWPTTLPTTEVVNMHFAPGETAIWADSGGGYQTPSVYEFSYPEANLLLNFAIPQNPVDIPNYGEATAISPADYQEEAP